MRLPIFCVFRSGEHFKSREKVWAFCVVLSLVYIHIWHAYNLSDSIGSHLGFSLVYGYENYSCSGDFVRISVRVFETLLALFEGCHTSFAIGWFRISIFSVLLKATSFLDLFDCLRNKLWMLVVGHRLFCLGVRVIWICWLKVVNWAELERNFSLKFIEVL